MWLCLCYETEVRPRTISSFYENITFSLFIFGGHLGCFHILAVANSVAMNIYVKVFVQTYVSISLGYPI